MKVGQVYSNALTRKPNKNLSDDLPMICPIGYIVPAKFGVHFFPRVKNAPKRTKLHLNEIGLTIIISIFEEDNVFSITAGLPYGPPVNTDIDYYRTFFGLFLQVLRG